MEQWKPLYDRYEISDQGNIRRINGGRLLSTKKPDFLGYCHVTIIINGKQITKSVHRLVATAFIPNPDSKRQVHHKNGDKTDNRAVNLEWVNADEHGKKEKERRDGKSTKYHENWAKRQKMSFFVP